MCAVCESAMKVAAASDELVLACNAKVSLRRVWSAALHEPVPDRLTELLAKLK
jgi:hypothetical protein